MSQIYNQNIELFVLDAVANNIAVGYEPTAVYLTNLTTLDTFFWTPVLGAQTIQQSALGVRTNVGGSLIALSPAGVSDQNGFIVLNAIGTTGDLFLYQTIR